MAAEIDDLEYLPPLLSPEQVAEMLQVSVSLVKKMLASGEMPGGIKVASLWRIRKRDFEKYLEGK